MKTILILTATYTESKAVLSTFSKTDAVLKSVRKISYYDIGVINNANVYLVQSEMGTTGPGASLITAYQAIDIFRPIAVIMVGMAFGVNRAKQKIGDILVSQRIFSYDLKKVSPDKLILRGPGFEASTQLLRFFRAAELNWHDRPVSCTVFFGTILSGETLVNNNEFKQKIIEEAGGESIGGEMEGSGLYSAANALSTDWIMVKGICDWADGSKSDDSQNLAAMNAALYTKHVITRDGFYDVIDEYRNSYCVPVAAYRRSDLSKDYVEKKYNASRVDIVGVAMSSCLEELIEDEGKMRNWIYKGAKVRIMFMDHRSTHVEQRAMEDGSASSRTVKDVLKKSVEHCRTAYDMIENDLKKYGNNVIKGSLEIRLINCCPHFTIYRTDDEILWGMYSFASDGIQLPVFSVCKQQLHELYNKLTIHFERLWDSQKTGVLFSLCGGQLVRAPSNNARSFGRFKSSTVRETHGGHEQLDAKT